MASLEITPNDQGEPQAQLIFHNTDHLTSSNVDTDSDGQVIQLLDYFPYGKTRIDDHAENYANDYQFTGKERDQETDLSYFEARYYDSSIGRFISQDPAFKDSPENFLEDPQQLNSYSYARNNPLRYNDPTGQSIDIAGIQAGINAAWAQLGQIQAGLDRLVQNGQIAIGNAAEYAYQNNAAARMAMDHPIAAGAVIGIGVGILSVGGIAAVGGTIACGSICGFIGSSLPILSQADKAVNTSQRLRRSLEVLVKDSNKLNHVFQDKHLLTQLTEKLGSQQNVLNTVVQTVERTIPSNYSGFYEKAVNIAGQDIIVRGRVLDGVVRVGTAFIKK